MAFDTQAIRAYFFKLGLAPEIADIYLALHAFGPQSISALARNSGVERTRIYRLEESLLDSGLIEVEKEYKRSIFKAAPITNLQILISKKEQEVRDLQSELQDLHRELNHNALTSPTTRVQFYQGTEGLKQMFWNQTKGSNKKENLSILYENMQIRTKSAFFERWVAACNDKDLRFRGIISDNFIKTQQEWYGTYSNERLKNWDSRYVSDALFPITHSMIIYDNVLAYYNWKDGEVFGIEIHNQEIADAQRLFFEMLWLQAPPVDDLVGPTKSIA